jgi:hypothetical protein
MTMTSRIRGECGCEISKMGKGVEEREWGIGVEHWVFPSR